VEQTVDNRHHEAPAQRILSFEQLDRSVEAAFAVWDEVDCSYIRLIKTAPGHCMDIGLHRSHSNANRVFFRSSGWIDPDAPWRLEEQIALTSVFFDEDTGEILDVDVEVNAEFFELTTRLADPRTDIQNALAHEVGHLVGLDHSERSNATMWRTAEDGETDKRSLSQDDIDGICSLYPLAQNPDDCREPLGGLDIDCQTAEACTPPIGGVSEFCVWDEPVCCCDRAGGLGQCGWTDALTCAETGRHGVLQIDESSACQGARPGVSYTCCCQVDDETGASCAWRRATQCENQNGVPGPAVTAEVLCGPPPGTKSCGCRAAGERSTWGRALATLASLLWRLML
jgi:hypothetical protein